MNGTRGLLILSLVLVALLGKGLVWILVLPPLQGPDEAAHLVYVQFLAETGRIPVLQGGRDMSDEVLDFARRTGFFDLCFHADRQFDPSRPDREALAFPSGLSRASEGQSSAGGYPPLYYGAASVAYRAAREKPLTGRFYAARCASLAFGLAAAAAAWIAGRRLAPGSPTFAPALALVTGLQPMSSMATATVTNDSALVAFSSLFALWVVVVAADGPTPWRAALGGGVCGGALLVKTSALWYVPFAILLLGWESLRRRQGVRRMLGNVLSLSGAACAVDGAWALFSWRHYGSLLGAVGAQAPQATGDGTWTGYFITRFVGSSALGRLRELWVDGFWARFGWLDTFFQGRAVYVLLTVLPFAAVAGLVVVRLRKGGRGGPDRFEWRACAWLALAVIVNVAFLHAVELAYYVRWHGFFLQGRYLLSALTALTAVLLAGLRGPLPDRFRPALDVAATGAALVLNVASLGLLLDRYYGVVLA